MPSPPEHFDGWRLDVGGTWEAYNRIYFSYKRPELEKEKYLRRLYVSHFVVFSYSFVDAVVSDLLSAQLGVSKTQINKGSLKDKVEKLDHNNSAAGILDGFERFWSDLDWVRTELVHPKRRDHMLPNALDQMDIAQKIRLLNVFSVRAFAGVNLEFPYWLTGWNYVNSMGNDSVSQGIVLIGNQEFKARLTMMLGYHDPRYRGRALETVENYLVGEQRFEAISRFMDTLGFETQPIPEDIGFSLMPILTKVWWDRDKMGDLRALRQKRYNTVMK